MNVVVNDAERTVPEGTTVAELLAQPGRDPEQAGAAVARNGEVVARSTWERTTLADGDRIDVLTASQGG